MVLSAKQQPRHLPTPVYAFAPHNLPQAQNTRWVATSHLGTREKRSLLPHTQEMLLTACLYILGLPFSTLSFCFSVLALQQQESRVARAAVQEASFVETETEAKACTLLSLPLPGDKVP